MSIHQFRKKSQLERKFVLSGNQHFIANISFAFSVMSLSWLMVNHLTWQMLLMFPFAVLTGTLVEYWGHRALLHVHRPAFKTPYKEHTLSHHFYFTHESIEMEKEEDLNFILFNITGLVFFVIIVGGALSVIIGILAGKDYGLFFMGLCGLYFLTYELFHTIYHLPLSHVVFRVKLFRDLRNHHLIHHDQRFMNSHNFGIITSFWDRVFKTSTLKDFCK